MSGGVFHFASVRVDRRQFGAQSRPWRRLAAAANGPITKLTSDSAHRIENGVPNDSGPVMAACEAATLLAGTPALTFTGMIGAALAVTLHRGGLLLAVLVLPLSIPVLIFGVAASQAAIAGPQPFGTPFSILCALTLVSFVIGPFAAAASLRHGLD